MLDLYEKNSTGKFQVFFRILFPFNMQGNCKGRETILREHQYDISWGGQKPSL